ncbi:MAG: sensor domain-containing diguanylate cyclase, partial [Candidatus Bathyarchaeota archaeon]|nr:sensor domain-containing diguanylate cyclase [Candidatus Bathyarchaeota archaeon]
MSERNATLSEYNDCEIASWSPENHPDGVFWATLEGQITFANLALHTMGGYELGSLIGRNMTDIYDMIKSSDIGPEGHLTSLVIQKEETEISTPFRRADGDSVSVSMSLSVPSCSSGMFVVFVKNIEDEQDKKDIVCQDIGAQPEGLNERRLTNESTDTGLRHRFFEKALSMTDQSQKTGSALSLLFVYIDHFKEINDQFGHSIGDKALRKAALSIVDTIRSGDLFFRLARDEFVILLPSADARAAQSVADRIRKGIKASGIESGLELTASVGVAMHRPGEDIA